MPHSIRVNGKEYEVKRVGTSAKRASASVRGSTIIIRVPASWPREEIFKAALELKKKIAASLQDRPDKFGRPQIQFKDGEEAVVFGIPFKIKVVQGGSAKSSSAKFKDGTVEVRVAEGLDERMREEHISNLARRVISDRKSTRLNSSHIR
jgi:hypothetical protein